MLDALACHPKEDDAYDGENGIERISCCSTMNVEVVIAEKTYPYQDKEYAKGAECHLPLAFFVLENICAS